MKKPGLKKRRPPGGGAAGRAYQFGIERDTGTESHEPPPTEKPQDKSSASKKPERKKRVPKKPK